MDCDVDLHTNQHCNTYRYSPRSDRDSRPFTDSNCYANPFA
jgi:hypothetical protein